MNEREQQRMKRERERDGEAVRILERVLTSCVASLQRACVKLFNCIFFAITFKTINSHTHTQSEGG